MISPSPARLDSESVGSTAFATVWSPLPIDLPWQSTRLPQSAALSTESTEPGRPEESGRVESTGDGRDWVVDLGLAVGGLAAIIASFTTLTHLAHLCGWGRLDWLLPVTVDTFVITATRVWLSRRTQSRKVRRFAARNALGAIGLSLAGNAAYHAIQAQAWSPGEHRWLLVVAVSSIPPVAIGLISHLAVLRSRDAEFAAAESTAVESTRPSATTGSTVAPTSSLDFSGGESTIDAGSTTRLESTPRGSGDPTPEADSPQPDSPARRPTYSPDPVESTGEVDPLLDRARDLDRAHREQNQGRPIGAEPIRKELKIAAHRARALRDEVRGLHAVDDDTEATG